jgi:hypothetical protein
MPIDPTKHQIAEGIAGVWFYHLAPRESTGTKALCGAQTMKTSIPVSAWGHRSEHIRERYCKECEELAGKEGNGTA